VTVTGSGSTSRIHEGGYQRYTGPRLGPGAAVRSLIRQTMLRVMGLRRPARTKALPFLSVIIAYLPAITFVGLVALVPRQVRFVPEYAQYYGFITAAILLFVTFVAPEALCPDRRSRVLSLYLASPLTRTTYVLGKVASVAGVLLLVTLGPPLLLLIGLVLQGAGPHGVTGVLSVLVRIMVSGVAMSAFYTAVSLAVSSLTDRRAFASGGILLLVIGSGVVSQVVVQALGLSSGFDLLSVNMPPIELVARIYGKPGILPDVSTAVVAAALVAYTVVALGLTWVRYQRLQVTR
jgi:ABC-2 type transport system permease protein